MGYMPNIVGSAAQILLRGSIELHIPNSIRCFLLSGLPMSLWYKQILISGKQKLKLKQHAPYTKILLVHGMQFLQIGRLKILE